MFETVTISKFKATCLRLLSDVKRTGRPLLVTRKGEPIAMGTPPPPPKPRVWPGSLKETIKITGILFHLPWMKRTGRYYRIEAFA